jgi:hypothetical protein
MMQNVGKLDRIARVLAVVVLMTCGVLAPLGLAVRLAAFVVPGVYLLGTALAGTCLGYRLLGMRTCPVK